MAALQAALATQQAWSADLERDLRAVATERALEVAAVRQEVAGVRQEVAGVEVDLDRRYLIVAVIAGAVVALLGFLGLQTYKSIREWLNTEIAKVAKVAMSAADPTQVVVRLPRGRGLDQLHDRLQMSGFERIRWYKPEGLADEPRDGVTVVHIRGLKADGDRDQAAFREFVTTHRSELAVDRVAYVLYFPGPADPQGYQIDANTIAAYENVVVANMPITAANAILLVARGLQRPGASTP